MNEWTWEKATPRERADFIRSHLTGSRPSTEQQICELFGLTPMGFEQIVYRREDWKPEYERAQ